MADPDNLKARVEALEAAATTNAALIARVAALEAWVADYRASVQRLRDALVVIDAYPKVTGSAP